MDVNLVGNSINGPQNRTMTSNTHTNGKKRKKMSQEERTVRSRERNRVHARKIRAKKKLQAEALQHRIGELKADGDKLRQLVDERYTASLLLGLSQTQVSSGKSIELKPSKTICGHAYLEIVNNPNWFGGDETALPTTISTSNHANGDSMNGHDNNNNDKKNRKRSKFSPQERERIRRERNRVHAKRTRDRKKMFLEASEHIINRMEHECFSLREYLVSIEAMSLHEAEKGNENDRLKRLEILRLSMSPFDDEINMNPNVDMNVQNQQGLSSHRILMNGNAGDVDVNEYLNDKTGEGEGGEDTGMEVDVSVAEGLYGLRAFAMQQYVEEGRPHDNNGSDEGSSLGSNNGDTSNESTESNQNEKSSSSNSTGSGSGSGSDDRDGLTQKALNSRNQQQTQQQNQQSRGNNSGSEDGATSGSNSNNSNDASNDLSLQRSSSNGVASTSSGSCGDGTNKFEASSSNSNSPIENSSGSTDSNVDVSVHINISGYDVDSNGGDLVEEMKSTMDGIDTGDDDKSSLSRQKLEEMEKHLLLANEMEAAVSGYYVNYTEKE